jgi:hypothetical protein
MTRFSERVELIARIGAAITGADPERAAVLRDALAALVEDHAVIAKTDDRKKRDRERKRYDGTSTESTDSKESTENGAPVSTESAESSEFHGIRAPLSPAPSSSFPTPHITPSSPPLPGSNTTPRAREAKPTGDQREAAKMRERIRAALDATALLILDGLPEQTGEHWPEVDRFLVSRSAHTWPAWLREFAKLLGPATGFVGADLATACADALALDEPLGGPHALRAFVEKARASRREQQQRTDTDQRRRQHGTPSITEAAAQRDKALVARDEEDGRQRAAAAEQWRREHPDEAAELDRALALQFPGDGPFVAMARDSAFVARVVDRAQRKAS